jgi:hypothetical protein
MKAFGLFATALLLAACADTGTGTAPVPSGGSAGAQGEAYCETVPSNPDDREQWEQLCNESGR